MNQVSITALRINRNALRTLLQARKDAKRDLATAVMPFTRKAAAKALHMLNLRCAAEVVMGARSRVFSGWDLV